MPKQVDHDQRRDLLAETAADIVAIAGVGGATVRDVARAANVSTGTVSHYFRNSRELLLAAYKLAFRNSGQRFVAALADKPGLEGLTSAIQGALPLDAQGTREWRVRMAFWGAGELADSIREFEESSGKQFRRLIEQRLRSLQREGRIQPGASAQEHARALEGILIGSAMQMLLSPGSESTAHLCRRLRRQLQKELNVGGEKAA